MNKFLKKVKVLFLINFAKKACKIAVGNYFFQKIILIFLTLVVHLFFFNSQSFSASYLNNTAYADYSIGGLKKTTPSNIVKTQVCSRASIKLLKYSSNFSNAEQILVSKTYYFDSSGNQYELPNPVLVGSNVVIDIGNAIPLISSEIFHSGEPIFIKLSDEDHNLDPTKREEIEVSLKVIDEKTGLVIDEEIIKFFETDTNSGVFAGFIQSGKNAGGKYDGILNVKEKSKIIASYSDKCGPNDSGTGITIIQAVSLVDPFGKVFDSSNGNLIDGVKVSLIDARTNLPATVFGDDGVSIFPSTVITGVAVIDSSGTNYVFSKGEFRFPLIPAGDYILKIETPSNYKWPSNVPDHKLINLPNGPFNVTIGSRGEFFNVPVSSIPIKIDIPLDPVNLNTLFIVKEASKDIVSIGDFLKYRITVENSSNVTINNVKVKDILPLGFKYKKGSCRVNGLSVSDPFISSDGRTLEFTLGNLLSNGKVEITYVVEVTVGAKLGSAKNVAIANGDGGARSNMAKAEVLVRDDFFQTKSFIVGKVAIGCDIQDKRTEIKLEKKEVLNIVEKKGNLIAELTSSLFDRGKSYEIEYNLPIEVNGVAVKNLWVSVILPTGSTYKIGSSKLLDKSVEPVTSDSSISYKLGDFPANFKTILSFTISVAKNGKEEDLITKAFVTFDTLNEKNLRTDLLSSVYKKVISKDSVFLPIVIRPNFESGSAVLTEEDKLKLDDVILQLNGYWIKTIDVIGHTDSQKIGGRIKSIYPDNYALSKARAESVANYLKRFLDLSFTTIKILGKGEDEPLVPNTDPYNRYINRRVELNIIAYKTNEIVKVIPINAKSGIKKTEFTVSETEKNIVFKEVVEEINRDSKNIPKLGDGIPGIRIYMEDGTFVITDKNGMYHFEGIKPGTHVLQVDKTTIPEGYEIMLFEENTRFAKSPHSQFVDIQGGSLWRADFYLCPIKKTENTDNKKVDEQAQTSKENDIKAKQLKKEDTKDIKDLTQEWIDQQMPGFEFIFPKDGYNPPIPSLNIAIKYNPSAKLKVFLNGKEVDNIFLDSKKTSSSLLASVAIWAGVHLVEGDNLLEAIEYDSNGKEIGRVKKIVHYSGPPVKVEVIEEKSKLIADGKSPIVIALKFADKDGYPVREGILGEYKVLPPHMPLKLAKELQVDPLNKSSYEMSKYLIKENGIAFIELSPSPQTGEVILKFNMVDGEKEIRVWLKPEKRDWILVGLAEGTLGYKTSSGSKFNLTSSGFEDGFDKDGRIAFFAKGMLDEKWLLTLSYDSDRTGYKGNNKLFRTFDPSQYYTLYGDSSQQQYEAQSSKPLYIKLEKDRFYALYGDFQTGMNNNELSKYNRSFTGFKSELKEDKYEFNIFVSDSNQRFVKDELRGNGTSGLYSLSVKNIVINSEKITIEIRDRYKSEIILSSKTLARYIDYSIDYDTGKVFFKYPIPSVDENLNPVYIVVEYEVFDPTKTAYNYGGRGALKLFNKHLELGLSYVHEGSIGKDGDLLGADIKLLIKENTILKAEVAVTNTNNKGVDSAGDAYLVELSHNSDKLKGKIYFREQEKDFGLEQQNISEKGTRKMGVTGTYSLTRAVDLSIDLFRQYNLIDDIRRDLIEFKTTYKTQKYDFYTGLRYSEDILSNGKNYVSEQLLFGGLIRVLDNKLTIKIQRDQSFGNNKNADFPTRTMFGADYILSERLTVFAIHEILEGETFESNVSRIGMKSSLWKGNQINTSLEQQISENGTRIFSVMGLQQAWKVSEKWNFSAGLDRSYTIKKPEYRFNDRAYSPGAENDFTAVNFGVGYKEKKWGWNGRIEYRDSKTEDKLGLFGSIYGELKEGTSIGSALQFFNTDKQTSEQTFADLRLGIVYRPKISRWTILDRIDLIYDSIKGEPNAYDNWRVINNFNVNYKDSKKNQFTFQYSFKYVSESIDNKDYKGYTDLIGFEGRHDIKKDLDLGLRFRFLHSWNANQYKYSLGPSIGYSPAGNIWISVGYNLIGFTDKDFSKSDYTSTGIYINFRIKFDQESTKNTIKWLLGSPN